MEEPTTSPETVAPVVNDFETFISTVDPKVKAMIDLKISEARHKANQEAKGLRESKKTSEAVLEKIKARFERDTIDDDFLDELQRIPTEKLGLEERAKQFERKLLEERTKAEQYKAELTQMQTKIKSKERDDMVLNEISKVGIRSEALQSAMKLINLDSNMDEEGNWVFNNKPLGEYIADFIKQNQYLLGNTTTPGLTRQSAKQGSNPTFSLEYFNAQSKEYQRAHVNEYLQALKSGKL